MVVKPVARPGAQIIRSRCLRGHFPRKGHFRGDFPGKGKGRFRGNGCCRGDRYFRGAPHGPGGGSGDAEAGGAAARSVGKPRPRR